MEQPDRERVRQDGRESPTVRDGAYFDERADRFREVQRELADRACLSPTGADGSALEGVDGTLSTPAAYGSIDDGAVVEATSLPAWYRDRLAREETLSQRTAGCSLEATPAEAGTDDPTTLAAEEYLRLDVLVDGRTWETYVPIPRTPAEYEGSTFARLRERLDGRPVARFHCARMPIKFDRGRYVPDYGPRTHGRWLREHGFVRWTAEDGYELKPGLGRLRLAAAAAAVAAGGLVAVAATAAFLVALSSVPELFLIGLWYLLPMAYLGSVSVTGYVYRTAFERFGANWRRRRR